MLIENCKIIDLTHPISEEVPTWDNSCGFQLKIGVDNDEIVIHTSTGTHIDSPAYLGGDHPTIDTIPLEQLVAPAALIDVSSKADADYEISPQDIRDYEDKYGRIAAGSLIVGFTGWSKHWPNKKAYRNVDAKGQMHYPTFAIEAIEYLINKNIAGIAIDSFAPERITSDTTYPIHKLLFSANKYIIENIANAHRLPPKGAYIVALPLKIKGGGEAPARVIGLIP